MTNQEKIQKFLNGSNRQSVIISDNDNKYYLGTATPFADDDYMIYRPANTNDLKKDISEIETEKIKPFLFYLEENKLNHNAPKIKDAKKELVSDGAKIL